MTYDPTQIWYPPKIDDFTQFRNFSKGKLYDDMKHDSDKLQNRQQIDELTTFRNGFEFEVYW